MRVAPTRAKTGCTCVCHKCDQGHHCGNPPNCYIKK